MTKTKTAVQGIVSLALLIWGLLILAPMFFEALLWLFLDVLGIETSIKLLWGALMFGVGTQNLWSAIRNSSQKE